MTHGEDERYAGVDPEVGIEGEIEEDGEAHLRESLERDDGFRRVWEANRAKRELGMLVLDFRLERGLSQRELASRVGTSQNRIYLIENGEANPTLETLQRLSEVLGFALEIRSGALAAR